MITTVIRSEDIPVSERFAYWYELVSSRPAPNHFTTEHTNDFRADGTFLHVGPLQVCELSFPALHTHRTPALIRKSDPELYELGLIKRGVFAVERGRRQVEVQAGDFLPHDTSHPYESRVVTERADMIVVRLPRTVLPLRANEVAPLLGQRIPSGDPMGAVMASFLGNLVAGALTGSWTPADASRFGSVALDLTTAFLGRRTDAERRVSAEQSHAMLIRQIRAFIEENLGDSRLTAADLAAAHNVSVRSLHRIFQIEGTTVGSWVRHRRLERCRQDLADPCLVSRPVHAVGARWGFSSGTDFSRAFRGAYGVTPGEYRRTFAYGRAPDPQP
ncbi:helix-turn-helix domain-containing protein [Streptomyces sp. NPDC051976]|uniref:AraC-like ligand-binding domain-containing protein n=1 Tax=Streptomyces sp. NPDC051976 TaxID=3154947 RepID=UPI0034374100